MGSAIAAAATCDNCLGVNELPEGCFAQLIQQLAAARIARFSTVKLTKSVGKIQDEHKLYQMVIKIPNYH
jgi:hypothetical protein